MKKVVSMVLALLMFLSCSAVFAESMGVQVIGGPEVESEPVSLDDIKLNAEIDIPGFAKLIPTSYQVVDTLFSYAEGRNETSYYENASYYSGNEADYAILRFDILNTQRKPVNFLDKYEVRVVYDDEYEYLGWAYQYNFNNKSYEYNNDTKTANESFVIKPADNFAIDPMYEGHFAFGCTLPNAVITNKAPMKMVITIDGNELTYNIRK